MERDEMAEYTLTVEEVAQEFGVTPGRIRQLITEKKLDCIMRAGAWFFKPEVLTKGYEKKKAGRPKKH